MSAVHVARQAVALPHLRPFGQAAGVPAAQVPEPLQVLTVSMPALHVEPQGVLAAG